MARSFRDGGRGYSVIGAVLAGAVLLALCPAFSARAGDLTGNGSASVFTGDSYDFVYGLRSQGGDAVADGGNVRITGGSVAMDVYGGSAQSLTGSAEAVGNSVTVTVVEAIGRRLRAVDEELRGELAA